MRNSPLPRLKHTLLLGFALGMTQLAAANECEWQENDNCCESSVSNCAGFLDDMQFRASLLYFKPTVNQSSYVISSTNNIFGGEVYPDGTRHLVSSNYKPGFRLEAIRDTGNGSALDLRFTYFNSSNSDCFRGDFLFDTIGFPGDGAQAPEDVTYAGTARISQHFHYYGADATINRLTLNCCPENMSFLFGLQYSYVKFHQRFTSVGAFNGGASPVNNLLIQNSTFWGIGPQIGVNYHHLLQFNWCPGDFTINTRARGALLCSCTEANLHYFSVRTGPVGVNLSNDDLWGVNPTANAQMGISYNFCCFGMTSTIEVGYEFLWCSQCVDKITGYDVAFAGDTLDGLDNLCMQGPFASISVVF